MPTKYLCFLYLLLFHGFCTYAQSGNDRLQVMFYNVENLFDVKDDTLTNDDEFLPEGDRHWTYSRLHEKLLNISKVILNASGWEVPGIIGLCEIENRKVLEALIQTTPLKKFPYKIIHKESPDHRGIDVALLYDSSVFNPLTYTHYPLRHSSGEIRNTREILYVSGIWNKRDTLHFFVNHWPSRYAGLLETRPARKEAAQVLRDAIDELQKRDPFARIVVMGDFNDQPFDESLSEVLGAKKISEKVSDNQLYNLSWSWLNNATGTLKYRSQWQVFDQFIVSGVLLNSGPGLRTQPGDAVIVNASFLFEVDKKYPGLKPGRTYTGFKYNGGFSDHLPVVITLTDQN